MSFTRSIVRTAQAPEKSLVISAAGEIDLATIEPFRLQVAHAVESDASRIVIDLREVTFLDSTTLSVLVQTHNHLTAQGRALTIRTRQAIVLRLFEITGLSNVLHVQN